MNTHYTYLLIDALCLFVPLVASFHPRIAFYRQWRFFWLPCFFTAAFFIAWDILFVHLGVWGFHKQYITGITFLSLPIEEIAFFICIPYACVFTYYCVKIFIPLDADNRLLTLISMGLGVVLLIIAVICYRRLYTSVSFSLLGIFLLILSRFSVHYFGQFFVSFAFIMIPFFLSNGALTGSFTQEPVVLYNDAHNLGIRMFTIPLEDTFYALLLLLMNVTGFELLTARREVKDAYSELIDSERITHNRWTT